MKKLFILTLPLLLLSCTDYGEMVTYNGTDVYYKDGATQTDADKLGAYLEESEFADGNEKSVQIVKNESGTWVFRMVVQEGAEEGDDTMFKLAALGISMGAFDGEPVDVDLCDNLFTTLKTIPYGFSDDESEDTEDTEDEILSSDSTAVD